MSENKVVKALELAKYQLAQEGVICFAEVLDEAAEIAERYRAALEKIGNLPGQDEFHKSLVREALHPTQPIQAHSKSEYKRLTALSVDVIPPSEGSET